MEGVEKLPAINTLLGIMKYTAIVHRLTHVQKTAIRINEGGISLESIVYIPRNYTDAGRIFGMFEIRNVIECVLLCFPIIILTFLSSPFGLTATIIICMVFVIPIGGFSLIGIHDYSLLTFIRLYIRWRKSRRILVYRGIKWINTRKTTKKKSV